MLQSSRTPRPRSGISNDANLPEAVGVCRSPDVDHVRRVVACVPPTLRLRTCGEPSTLPTNTAMTTRRVNVRLIVDTSFHCLRRGTVMAKRPSAGSEKASYEEKARARWADQNPLRPRVRNRLLASFRRICPVSADLGVPGLLDALAPEGPLHGLDDDAADCEHQQEQGPPEAVRDGVGEVAPAELDGVQ